MQIFHQLGISEGEAIRMFYSQVQLNQGLPFSINIPNQETREAMKEGEDAESLPSYKQFSDIRNEMGM